MDREDVVHIYNENTFKVKIMSSERKGKKIQDWAEKEMKLVCKRERVPARPVEGAVEVILTLALFWVTLALWKDMECPRKGCPLSVCS